MQFPRGAGATPLKIQELVVNWRRQFQGAGNHDCACASLPFRLPIIKVKVTFKGARLALLCAHVSKDLGSLLEWTTLALSRCHCPELPPSTPRARYAMKRVAFQCCHHCHNCRRLPRYQSGRSRSEHGAIHTHSLPGIVLPTLSSIIPTIATLDLVSLPYKSYTLGTNPTVKPVRGDTRVSRHSSQQKTRLMITNDFVP